MAIYEGQWLCKQCGAENLGRNEVCAGLDNDSGCGKARPEEVVFYLPENSPIVTHASALADAHSGTDWYCSQCTGANKNAYGGKRTLSCVHCGNPRDADDTDGVVTDMIDEMVPRGPNQITHASLPRMDLETSRMQSTSRTETGAQKPRTMLWIIALSVLGLLMWLIWHFFIAESTISGHVTGHRWVHTVNTESPQLVTEGDWVLPSSSKLVRSERKIRGYEDKLVGHKNESKQVRERVQSGTEPYVCGKKNLGNGYFEDKICHRPKETTITRTVTTKVPVYESRPVYGTWHTFTTVRWTHHRTYKAEGIDQRPYWPTYQLSTSERVSNQQTRYTMVITFEDGKIHEKDMSLEDWRATRIGQQFIAGRNRSMSVLSLKQKE